MPEYGLGDKSPEQLEEEVLNKKMIDSFKRMEATEAKAQQRKADAENSSVQAAESLRNLQDQIRELSELLNLEREARQKAEKDAKKSSRMALIVAIISLVSAVAIGIITISLQWPSKP